MGEGGGVGGGTQYIASASSSRQNPRFMFDVLYPTHVNACNGIRLIAFIFRTLDNINMLIKLYFMHRLEC